jgi:hypothetical protein
VSAVAEKATYDPHGERYFLGTDWGPWTEVDKETWVRAERSAGFQPNGYDVGQCATGGFSGRGVRGRIVYGVNHDYYREHEPEFYALLAGEPDA